MSGSCPHLKTLDDIDRNCIPGLVGVLHSEGAEGVRYAMREITDDALRAAIN